MKSLGAIARFLKVEKLDPRWENIPIHHVCLDSRQINPTQPPFTKGRSSPPLKKGDQGGFATLFCACPGVYEDGRSFIQEAIEAGALAIAYEEDGKFIAPKHCPIPLVPIENLSEKIFQLGPYFYNDPSESLTMIGVTGTNGKTSTTHYIAQILTMMGQRCGVIGTVGNGLWGALDTTNCTTPDPLHLQYLLAELRDNGATTVAMEVSSHGLEQRRVEGVKFDAAIFTNLTRDHLDYHGDMEHYAAAKAKLFSMPGLRFAVLNQDDPYSTQMQKSCSPQTKVLYYSSKNSSADIHVMSTLMQANGVSLKLASIWGEAKFELPLLGAFNISNILAVICSLCALAHPFSAILMALQQVKPVSGRMEKLCFPHYPTIVIDYAHTPDALEKALSAMREHCQAKIWVVFGCGGNRDRGKRPEMAKIAEQCADQVILTQDNSRLESITQIFADIMSGFKDAKKVHIEPDRQKAIEFALSHASEQDCVLLAGKGHETYMDIGGKKQHFDERDVVKNFIKGKKT